MKILIKNAQYLYGEELELRQGDILVSGNNIEKTGENLVCEEAEIFDAKGLLVAPGLCNAHLHSDENLFKGMLDNLPLELWMLYAYPPLEYGPFSERLIYLRTMLSAVEMIKSGVTAVQDDVSENPVNTIEGLGTVIQAYKDIGMRASVTANLADKPWKYKLPFVADLLPKELADRFQPAGSCRELTAYAEEAVKKFHEPGGMINFVIAPSGPQRCTDEFLISLDEIAKKYYLPVHTHILETKMQAITGPEFYGESIVEHLKSIGVLSDRMTIIHSVWMSDHDIELMGEAGVSVAHNPVSNLKLGSGIAPFRKLKNAGVNIAIGSDGMSSNDGQNIFEGMKFAALLHKVTDPDYNLWPTAKEVFKCGTQGGARSTLRHAYTGYIAEGMRADLMMLDLDAPAFVPFNDPLNHLVYCEDGRDVKHVMIDGKIVVKDREILTVNEKELLAELRTYLPKFYEDYERVKHWGVQLFPYVNQVYQRCVQTDIGVNRWTDNQAGWIKSE